MSDKPLIVIIAGPNGAGKTTFAEGFLNSMFIVPEFVNADLIALKLSPSAPEAVSIEAGRIMLAKLEELVKERTSFAFETTLASRSYLVKIDLWKREGYEVKLVFLELDSPIVAINRVAHRVAMGGHNIPEADIRRRFDRGKSYLSEYKRVVDEWAIYNGNVNPPELIEEGSHAEQ